MAEGNGKRSRRPLGPGGDAPALPVRQLSEEDVGLQGQVLLEMFIEDRLLREEGRPLHLQRPEHLGPSIPHVQEVGRYLRIIGDELDQDETLQVLIDRVPPHSPRETFFKVAKEIFADGVFNWGRIVALFYFAYRFIKNVLSDMPFVSTVVTWVGDFITAYLAPWIISRGGWAQIREYVGGPPFWQSVGITLLLGVACCLLAIFNSVKKP